MSDNENGVDAGLDSGRNSGGSDGGVRGGEESRSMEKVRSDERSRAMLKVLEESERGRVRTDEFKERTGLDRELHYQYEKLEDAGLIEVEYNPDATPEGKSPMKVAVLTERGEKAIAQGLSGDTADVTEDTIEDRVDALEDALGENREALEDVYEWIRKTNERLDRIEERLDALSGESVSELQSEDDEGFEWEDS